MRNPLKPRKTATQKRSQETVDAILESTTRILSQDDASALSTNRIAEKAGVSIGSLYQYFPSKESILSALVEKHLSWKVQAVDKALAEMVSSSQSNEELVEAFVGMLIDLKLKNLKFERALSVYFTRSGDFEMLKKLDEQLIQKLGATVEPLKSRVPAFDSDWTVFILYHTLRGVIITTSTNRPQDLKSPKLKKELVRLVKGYLLSPVQV